MKSHPGNNRQERARAMILHSYYSNNYVSQYREPSALRIYSVKHVCPTEKIPAHTDETKNEKIMKGNNFGSSENKENWNQKYVASAVEIKLVAPRQRVREMLFLHRLVRIWWAFIKRLLSAKHEGKLTSRTLNPTRRMIFSQLGPVEKNRKCDKDQSKWRVFWNFILMLFSLCNWRLVSLVWT